MFAVIGGSGLAKLAELTDTQRRVVRTPYGDASGALTFGQLDGSPICFLARHGYGHTIAPHEINYRANLWALHEAGVDKILAVVSVGGIAPDLAAGSLVIPHQIIDYTHGRKSTFFEGSEQPVKHVDFTHPYELELKDHLIQVGFKLGMTLRNDGTYGCTQGPRLETAAEIKRMAGDGCDVVGMTGMPEAVLARELGLRYAAIAVVANHAAGVGDSRSGISIEAMGPVLDNSMAQVRRLISAAVK